MRFRVEMDTRYPYIRFDHLISVDVYIQFMATFQAEEHQHDS